MIADRFFLQLTGWIRFKDFEVQSVEIIGYDPVKKVFPSTVFANMDGNPFSYQWDVQGNTVTHSGVGATYKGTVSEDGNMITGSWRPEEDVEATDGRAYDMTMYQVT